MSDWAIIWTSVAISTVACPLFLLIVCMVVMVVSGGADYINERG